VSSEHRTVVAVTPSMAHSCSVKQLADGGIGISAAAAAWGPHGIGVTSHRRSESDPPAL
jgi:hypothetical protein